MSIGVTTATFQGQSILIGEFSFRAKDSGLPNTQGAGPLLQTQTDRANAYERYVNAALADPRVVGIHWYCWADEPKEGRADGENSDFGLVKTSTTNPTRCW